MSGAGPRKRIRPNPSNESAAGAGAGAAPAIAPPATEEVPAFWGKGGDPKVFFFLKFNSETERHLKHIQWQIES